MQIASEVSGVPLPGLRAKPGMLKAMSALMAVVEKVIPLPESYTGEGLRIVAGVTYLGDNSKAKRELGFDPRPLREAWVETVQHEMRLL
jgi:dihydroflavonol-4-reductase